MNEKRKFDPIEYYGSLEQMLDDLPENRPLYKDSGTWEIRSEDLDTVHFTQGCDESFGNFIKRAYEVENYYTNLYDDAIQPKQA